MFSGLSLPAMLVAENSKVVALNERAAELFLMPVEEILGQRWAGLDANATLMSWRGYWKQMADGQALAYRTDIETSRRFMRPINVEVRRVSDEYALITLSDLIGTEIISSELELLSDELQVGRWSYNRVDGRLYLSEVCRQLLGLPEGSITKEEIGELMRARMAPADFKKLTSAGAALLTSPGEQSADLVVEAADSTVMFTFTCHSVGNELHVTHLHGLLRRRDAILPRQEHDQNQFTELAAFSLEQARDIIFWTRPDGSVRYGNHAAADLLGYSLEEFRSINVQQFAPTFREEERQKFWQQLRERKSMELDYELVRKDGSRVAITSVINYIRFGEEEFACSINRDVTQRRARAKRQRLMQFTFDRSEDLILWSRPDGSIHAANESFLKATGYTREQLDSLVIDDIYGAGNKPTDDLWDRLRQGEVITRETQLNTTSGILLPVRARSNYLSYEGEELKCVYMYDISSEREKERTLSLAKRALDTSADCILWLDEQFRIQYANQTLRDLLPPQMARSVENQDIQSVLPNLDRSLIGPGQQQDFDVKTAQGDVKHMNLTCSLVAYKDRNYFVLSARDISVMAQERQELETAYTEVEVMRDRLRDENLSLREENDTKYNVNNIITVSPKYQSILTKVGQVADVDTTVLITGETGTGKELLARAVHQLSAREDFPLIKINCAALPESLIESELFGHEKGAFTGAVARKKGRFEMADRGTIFLDEIGELPLDLQAKLLRVLQEDEFERVGGQDTIKVDVRLIAATNRDLEKMVAKGRFREDLYYRLNVFPIHNLPLRDRPEDIPVLVEYFTKKYAKRQGKRIVKINTADIRKMATYDFPGNIRELENIVERSVVLCQSDTLNIEFVQRQKHQNSKSEKFLNFTDMQRKHIIDALKRTGGRVTGPSGAGVLLDINDRTLVSKIRKLGIQKHEYLL